MSTISSATSTVSHAPKQRLLDSITSQVSAGKISSADETALDSAVDSIDNILSSSGSSSNAAKLSPSGVKSRVDDLISQQVENGALTSDQAETLKQVFAQGPGGPDGESGSGKVGASGHTHHGHPPGPPPSDDTGDASATNADSTDTTGQSAGDLLASFMKQLQSTQGQASGYGANAASGGSWLAGSPLLLDFGA